MKKPHRIAAGGIIIKDDTVLLVRYRGASGGTYLVGPGGGLEDDENVVQAVIRETREETNVIVRPVRPVIIEDLECIRYKMIKVWMICDAVGGNLSATDEAKKEGILEAAWFTKPQLAREIVYPALLIPSDWNQMRSENWRVECLPSRKADI